MTLFEICKNAERFADAINTTDLEILKNSLKLVASMSINTLYMDVVFKRTYYVLTKKDNAYFLKVGNNLLYVTEDLVISAFNPTNHAVLYFYANSKPIDRVHNKSIFETAYPNMSAYISAFNLIVS